MVLGASNVLCVSMAGPVRIWPLPVPGRLVRTRAALCGSVLTSAGLFSNASLTATTVPGASAGGGGANANRIAKLTQQTEVTTRCVAARVAHYDTALLTNVGKLP